MKKLDRELAARRGLAIAITMSANQTASTAGIDTRQWYCEGRDYMVHNEIPPKPSTRSLNITLFGTVCANRPKV